MFRGTHCSAELLVWLLRQGWECEDELARECDPGTAERVV